MPTITVPSISIQGESLLTAAVKGSHSVCTVLLAVIHFPELTFIDICLLSNTVTVWSLPTNVMHLDSVVAVAEGILPVHWLVPATSWYPSSHLHS